MEYEFGMEGSDRGSLESQGFADGSRFYGTFSFASDQTGLEIRRRVFRLLSDKNVYVATCHSHTLRNFCAQNRCMLYLSTSSANTLVNPWFIR